MVQVGACLAYVDYFINEVDHWEVKKNPIDSML